MPGIFKKFSANDIKITPFEAHKRYSNTNLSSLGASTDFVYWSPYNKSTYTTSSIKYSQIDKLYYRDYIRERAHRLELNDATYTTQERRLYDSANIISLSQKTFGSEVQPSSFILSCSYSSSAEQFHILDDGFGNLYDSDKGKDNFPNEDYRLIYIGPTQAFKRNDLTIDYETGNQYVNNPFSDGYSRTVYDDSYFLNEVEFNNVNFISSNNLGFYSIKTIPLSVAKTYSETQNTVNLTALSSSEALVVSLGEGTLDGASDPFESLFDGVFTDGVKINDAISATSESLVLTFDPPLDVTQATLRTFTRSTSQYHVRFNSDDDLKQLYIVSDPGADFEESSLSFNGLSELNKIEYFLSESLGPGDHFVREIELDTNSLLEEKQSKITIPHQPQFNFEKNDDFTINFYYDLNTIDHTNSTIDGDYFILTKEGNKTIAALPSEKTTHTSLSVTGSSDLKKIPIGNQFPYRIYYKGNTPSANTASLFFERSDGEITQFVSSSLFLSGSTDTQKFISCKNENGNLTLNINNNEKVTSTSQNSPTLNKTVSNKADITLYSKPNPNGSYSNFIGYSGGQISQLMMWNQGLSPQEITNVSESIVGTPNIGNMFYDNGFAVTTHPSYRNILNNYDVYSAHSALSASITSSEHPNINLQFAAPAELEFNNDGTKLFISSVFAPVNGTISEYNLTTPYDISTLEGVKSYVSSNSNLDSGATAAQGFRFTPEGNKIIISRNVDSAGTNYYSYDLSSSFDLGSAHNEQEYNLPQTSSAIDFSNNGRTLITSDTKGILRQYKLSDPYNLDNFTLEHTYSLGSSYSSKTVGTLRFDPSGYKLFAITVVDAHLFYLELTKPYDIRSIKNQFEKSIKHLDPLQSSGLSYASGLEFNSDGTKMYISAQTNSASQRARNLVYQFDLNKSINKFEYKNTHQITENEYQCTITEDEFEFTRNSSTLKIPFSDSEDIANFATGSNFKPYVTSIGLYDDNGNLLVTGKLGQPIKASSETDTTFVIRFDT